MILYAFLFLIQIPSDYIGGFFKATKLHSFDNLEFHVQCVQAEQVL